MIREFLNDPPMSLNELADTAGVDVALLSRIKNGTRRLTPAVAGKLAEALDAWTAEYRARTKSCTEAARHLRRTTRKTGGK
jgi:plasmid maintenance system antidote protein VapI